MPRSIKLSWQPGSRGKPGYWKKFYKGKVHYFPAGSGKSDMVAYDAALVAWERTKRQIDAKAPRKHEEDYLRCLGEWEQVQAWSSQHGEQDWAARAERKLAELRQRLAAPKLVALRDGDWFQHLLDPFSSPGWKKELEKLALVVEQFGFSRPAGEGGLIDKPDLQRLDRLEGVDARVRSAVWKDRLAMQQQKAAPKGESVGDFVATFLASKTVQEQAKQLSTARLYALKLHLQFFQDWIGKDTPVVEVDGSALTRFHGHLLEKLAAGSWQRRTAWHYLSSVKALVNWLYDVEAIAAVPRIMRRLLISKPPARIDVFTVDEVNKLLAGASQRTRLYILLALNTGATQVDISDLKIEEVIWAEGRIIRRRSKTKDEEHVPVVNYCLWSQTFELLNLERATKGNRVLMNANDSPLLCQEIKADGKLRKCDNVKSSFDRLKTKTGINKSFKLLRKTSASLLKDSPYADVVQQFLGHAPTTVADRNYAKAPRQRFDQAVEWLGKQYGLVETTAVTGIQQPVAASAAPSPSPEPDVDERKPKGPNKTPSPRAGRRSKGLPV